ncbi:cupin domain-containing protein [Flavobacterium nitrogenifigens]|uniref:Cupin domain-containing protein n=1 Tax=Flavobacterium nitrogenifigens TaxID=1617283 RepID=A0A521E028_9FLAO|nr:cupin domain-containing protein [Flavobacterium nitrogenifigens]KAF2333942.1 cupin domain-containing protein [Flavobacterium nitrogenifigens]SMO77232.1 Cupin domain-containing protein [Flavobacterium nitrogenifigens]
MKTLTILKTTITVLVFQQTFSQETKKETPQYTIENCVNHFDINKATKTKVGYQYWFANKDFTQENTLKMSIVEPGKSTHAPHHHPEEEFFYILEGTAEFFLDGKTVTAGPNTSFYCPPNAEHGISNAGKTDLKYLVIKKDLR